MTKMADCIDSLGGGILSTMQMVAISLSSQQQHLDMVVSIVLVIRVLLPICLIMTIMEKILTHFFDCDFI